MREYEMAKTLTEGLEDDERAHLGDVLQRAADEQQVEARAAAAPKRRPKRARRAKPAAD